MMSSPLAKKRRLGVVDPPKLSEILSQGLVEEREDMDEDAVVSLLEDAGFSEDIQTAFKGSAILKIITVEQECAIF